MLCLLVSRSLWRHIDNTYNYVQAKESRSATLDGKLPYIHIETKGKCSLWTESQPGKGTERVTGISEAFPEFSGPPGKALSKRGLSYLVSSF